MQLANSSTGEHRLHRLSVCDCCDAFAIDRFAEASLPTDTHVYWFVASNDAATGALVMNEEDTAVIQSFVDLTQKAGCKALFSIGGWYVGRRIE